MNDFDKNASIDTILDRGLVKPPAAGERIGSMLRELGLRFIFWDTGYSLFFAALTFGCAFVLFMLMPEESGASAAVAIAPLLMLLAVSFAETSERLGGLYEIKQTCRYTIRQIAALRVIVYSAAGTVLTAIVAFAGANGEGGFLSLFPLCLAALFVCSALSLSMLHRTRNEWFHALFTAGWIFANLALGFAAGERWENLLRGMPAALSIGFAVIGAALFVWQLSKMLREVKPYAIA
ncbi:hypothetical protein [Saccharibacillus deserti]|uniref:hypothetical protein n=1 Tax=Saccharibacillus deserti TaxID=1634444 RepID=UPI001553F3C6|nr:hypothetical protein [Saccharibacillus deserti]